MTAILTPATHYFFQEGLIMANNCRDYENKSQNNSQNKGMNNSQNSSQNSSQNKSQNNY